MAEFNLLQNLHLCTQKSVCAINFESFGEIGASFSLDLQREHSLLKLIIKKLSPKINVKNIAFRPKGETYENNFIHTF